MVFWCMMLLFTLMIPAVMIGFGRSFFKRPPRDINATFGYRTTMSMKNQETWKLADLIAGCGRTVECGRCVICAFLLKANLCTECGNIVAAVRLFNKCLVFVVVCNRLENGNIAGSHGEFRLEINACCKVLYEEPRSNNFLRIVFLEDTYARTLRNNFPI